jgi:hypothetical protein
VVEADVRLWPKPAVREQRSLSDRRSSGGWFRPVAVIPKCGMKDDELQRLIAELTAADERVPPEKSGGTRQGVARPQLFSQIENPDGEVVGAWIKARHRAAVDVIQEYNVAIAERKMAVRHVNEVELLKIRNCR